MAATGGARKEVVPNTNPLEVGKSSGRITLLALTSFLVGTSQFVFTGILDRVAASIGVSVATAGQLITAYALASGIGTPLFMIAAARLDQRALLLVALLMIVAGLFATAFFPVFALMMVSRIVVGIGSGIYGVTSYAIAAKLAPEGRQAGALANLALGASTSLIIGVPLGRLVAAKFGWTFIFGAAGVLGALALAAAARWIPSSSGEAPARLGLQLSYLRHPRVLVSLGAAFTMFISYSAVNSYVAPVLIELTQADDRRISLLLMALGVASVVGSKLGGILADRAGLAMSIIGGMAVQAAALAMVLPVSAWNVLSLTSLLIWAAAAWSCGPTLNFNLVRIAPQASRILLSLNSTAVQLGFAAGAGLGGLGVAATGTTSLILWLGAAAVAVATGLMALSFGMAEPGREKLRARS